MKSPIHEKMMAAYELLGQGSISVAALENVRTLVKGIHPGIDEKLSVCSKTLDTLLKIQGADVITLSAEQLPEETDKQKKRKKMILFFIHSLKDLQSEIKRVDTEMSIQQDASWRAGRILKFAKGPFGLITLAAIVIVIGMSLTGHTNKTNVTTPTIPSLSPKPTIQVISYQGKQLPLSQLFIGHGPDCDSPHYHAITGKVTAIDGTVVVDPEGCGFGKVADTQVTTITK